MQPSIHAPSSGHTFAAIPPNPLQRSSFDRSHGLKTTFDADDLIPVFVDEVLPGDTFNLTATFFGRMFSRLKTPVMDNLYLDTFFFFVPTRLVWEHWEQFNGQKDAPDDTTTYTLPRVFCDNFPQSAATSGGLGDHFGIPPAYGANIGGTAPITSLPFRAYNLIWNEWFRDQNLQDPATVYKTDTDPVNWQATYPLRKRGKRHDYFTSSLPWPQKGTASSISLGVSAPVTGTLHLPAITNLLATLLTTSTTSGGNIASGSIGSGPPYVVSPFINDGSGNPPVTVSTDIPVQNVAVDDVTSSLIADLSAATPVTINALREAITVQQILELDARGGTRYTEILRAHFGVISPDARLQRPEYLGGGSQPLNVNPVQATDTAGLGTVAAFGTFGMASGFQQSFVEHGYIIGLASVRADLTYQQGINRMWSRETRYDFAWPTFAHLGEQAVNTREIFADDTDVPGDVFGYQERYAEYRYKPSEIHGKFRSDVSGTLDIYHLSQDFAALPELGPDFIESNTPMDRVLAVTTEPAFLLDAWFSLNCARVLPVYSVPGLGRL